jgi:hypothetical protein
MSYARQMLDNGPSPVIVDAAALARAIDALSDCAQACMADVDDDLGEHDVTEMVTCIPLCLNCADGRRCPASWLSSTSQQTPPSVLDKFFDSDGRRPLRPGRSRPHLSAVGPPRTPSVSLNGQAPVLVPWPLPYGPGCLTRLRRLALRRCPVVSVLAEAQPRACERHGWRWPASSSLSAAVGPC